MKPFVKSLLTAALFTCVTQAYATNTDSIQVTPAERTKIEEVVHHYLLTKPEVIMEAIQVLQKKQYEQAEQTIKNTQKTASSFANALFKQANDPFVGDANGNITIVEFFDYQCPHCIDMAPVIENVLKANPSIRIVFKEFPIRGPVSEFAARAALAANLQGKYYAFSHALLTANKPLTQALVIDIAKANGLDVEKLKKDMDGPRVESQLKDNMKLAQDLKLFGTPAFFIGKTDATGSVNYVPGQMNQKQLQAAIDKAK